MKLRGFNKNHKMIFYECPECEADYGDYWFKENKLRPKKVFACEVCGTALKVPNYKRFFRELREF